MLPQIVRQTTGQVNPLVDLALEVVLEVDPADGTAAMFDGGRLDLVHPIERRVVHEICVLAKPRMDDGLRVASAASSEGSIVVQQVASRVSQGHHPHVVTVGVGADRAGFQQALGGQGPQVVVQAVLVATVASLPQVAVEDDLERGDRHEGVALGVTQAVAVVAAPARLTVDTGRQREAAVGKRARPLPGIARLVGPRRGAAAIIPPHIAAIVVPSS